MKFHIFASKGNDDELVRDEADDEQDADKKVEALRDEGFAIEEVVAIDETSLEARRKGWSLW